MEHVYKKLLQLIVYFFFYPNPIIALSLSHSVSFCFCCYDPGEWKFAQLLLALPAVVSFDSRGFTCHFFYTDIWVMSESNLICLSQIWVKKETKKACIYNISHFATEVRRCSESINQWILYFKAATSAISGAGVVVIAFFRHIVIAFVLRVYFCISMGAGIVFWSSGLVCNILARDGLVVVVAPARRDLSGRRPTDRAPVRSAFSWISFFWISLWFFFRFLLIFLWISFF